MEEIEHVELGALEDALGFLLRLAQVRVFSDLFERLGEDNVRPGEFTALWVVGLNPGLRQGTVAARLNIKPAHMTKLVQRLVKAGLLRRATEAGDRRAVRLYLTEAGKAYVDHRQAIFLGEIDPERNRLDETETAELLRLLRKFNGIEGGTP